MKIDTTKIKSGDILITSNGNFMIINIDSYQRDNNDEYIGYGAIFVDDDDTLDRYNYEIQYMNKEIEDLIKRIENDCEIIRVATGLISLDYE